MKSLKRLILLGSKKSSDPTRRYGGVSCDSVLNDYLLQNTDNSVDAVNATGTKAAIPENEVLDRAWRTHEIGYQKRLETTNGDQAEDQERTPTRFCSSQPRGAINVRDLNSTDSIGLNTCGKGRMEAWEAGESRGFSEEDNYSMCWSMEETQIALANDWLEEYDNVADSTGAEMGESAIERQPDDGEYAEGNIYGCPPRAKAAGGRTLNFSFADIFWATVNSFSQTGLPGDDYTLDDNMTSVSSENVGKGLDRPRSLRQTLSSSTASTDIEFPICGIPTGESDFRACDICTEYHSNTQDSFPTLTSDCCDNHPPTHCAMCLNTWFETSLNSSVTLEFHCPHPSCNIQLSYQHISKFVRKDLFERFDERLKLKALGEMETWQNCLQPGCGSGQDHIGGDSDGNILTCLQCGGRTCVTCQSTMHDGLTCTQHQRGMTRADIEREEREAIKRAKAKEDKEKKKKKAVAEKVKKERKKMEKLEEKTREKKAAEQKLKTIKQNENWISSETKACPGPKCGKRIQKDGGCDHMTCSLCRHQFCWLCLAPYEPIRKQGNKLHKPYCAHYA